MDSRTFRSAFLSAIPAQNIGVPEAKYLYIPKTHLRALHPDHALVRGIRGAGKSVWWSVLQFEDLSWLLKQIFPSAMMPTSIEVKPGFGEQLNPQAYPGRDTLELLLTSHQPRLIWRTVVLWGVRAIPEHLETWTDRVGWVAQNPELAERNLSTAHQQMAQKQTLGLFVFDALDRTATTWDSRARLLDGLLENLLEFRSFRFIRLKAFVRPDMLVGPEIGRFPDASKVLTGAIDLSWPRAQLFGLLWQYLLNAPTAEGQPGFRELCKQVFHQRLGLHEGVWHGSDEMNTDEETQRSIFEVLAGEFMGSNRLRGYPYTWLPNHLADAYGQVSPRSFLAALREAAEDTDRCYPQHPQALHYEALKRGVQKASQIRVEEFEEDFPWIREVMKPLKELTVPCSLTQIDERWVKAKLKQKLGEQRQGVLPGRSNDFSAGLIEQLTSVGIFSRMPDQRINLPDVYRVGFGLKRLGGVKPLR